jgi:hypothetical protein
MSPDAARNALNFAGNPTWRSGKIVLHFARIDPILISVDHMTASPVELGRVSPAQPGFFYRLMRTAIRGILISS